MLHRVVGFKFVVSEERTVSVLRVCYLLDLLFDPEDGSSKFL
jgi:hypothetical protein